jgi:hypothetical protein
VRGCFASKSYIVPGVPAGKHPIASSVACTPVASLHRPHSAASLSLPFFELQAVLRRGNLKLIARVIELAGVAEEAPPVLDPSPRFVARRFRDGCMFRCHTHDGHRCAVMVSESQLAGLVVCCLVSFSLAFRCPVSGSGLKTMRCS